MTRIPDKDEHRRRWTALPMEDRRRIMRAVNRGQALESRPEAILAVSLARQQERFWSRAWLLGPVVSLVFARQGWTAYVANALVAALVMGGMSYFWYRRARRAEDANLAALGLTRAEAREPAPTEPADDGDGRAGTPHAANPPKRSRSKRRRS